MKKRLWVLSSVMVFMLVLSACTPDTAEPKKVEKADNASSVEVEAAAQDGAAESEEKTPKEVIAGLGETLDYGGLQMTLTSVNLYVDKSEYIVEKPGEGKEFVILNFIVENTKAEDEHVNMFYEDTYVDGFSVDPVMGFMNYDGDTIWGDVAAGKKRKGYVGYELEKGWNEIEFQYKPEVFGSQASKMKFVVTAADVSQ